MKKLFLAAVVGATCAMTGPAGAAEPAVYRPQIDGAVEASQTGWRGRLRRADRKLERAERQLRRNQRDYYDDINDYYEDVNDVRRSTGFGYANPYWPGYRGSVGSYGYHGGVQLGGGRYYW